MSKRKITMITFFYSFIVVGAYFSVIGSVMPMMREEYGLDYSISGIMMSALSVGYLVAGATVDIIGRRFGKKKTYIVFHIFLLIGLTLMMLVSNAGMLLFAAAIAGLSRGCIDTNGNRAVSLAAQGDDAPINFLQACYSMGTCIAPLITMACGASWRVALIIIIVMGAVSLIMSFHLSFDEEDTEKKFNTTEMQELKKVKKRPDYSFFKSRLFWQSALFLMCDISLQDSLIGWIVTFFRDSGTVNESTAQLLATVLYAVILVGRIVISGLASKFKPKYMLMVMAPGVLIWFSVMVLSNIAIFMVVGLIGLGFFMSGIYGAALACAGSIIDKYPMSMGMFITLPGIGAVVFPGLVGIVSNSLGVRSGIKVLYIIIAILFVNAIFNLKNKKEI